MKRKWISQTYLNEAEKYQLRLFMDEEDYYVSVKKLIHITEKFIIRHKIVAMDDGYYVMEVIPKEGHIAMRLFLNDKKEPVEYYFDIIKRTGVDPTTKTPYFDDLYLDITYLPDGETHVIDKEELEEALANQSITEEDYQLVLKEKNKLLKEIKNHTNKLLNIDYQKYLEGF